MKIHAFSTLGEVSHFAISGYFVISGFDITGVDCTGFDTDIFLGGGGGGGNFPRNRLFPWIKEQHIH